jgi:hypothetical protein
MIRLTLQHRQENGLMDLTGKVLATLSACYSHLQSDDSRWRAKWQEIAVSVNPNGPYFRSGSDGDNGQTGRKLVMDYYGRSTRPHRRRGAVWKTSGPCRPSRGLRGATGGHPCRAHGIEGMPDQAGLRPQQQRTAGGDLGDGRARGKVTPGAFRLRCDAGEGGSAGNHGRTGARDALLG